MYVQSLFTQFVRSARARAGRVISADTQEGNKVYSPVERNFCVRARGR